MTEHIGNKRCYRKGCRLPQCVRAHADHERQAKRERTRPDGPRRGNVRVDPTEARGHLLFLQTQGVGLDVLARTTGIQKNRLFEIRSGRRKYILRITHDQIMGVGTHLFEVRRASALTWFNKSLSS